jgi:hypothetical protein
MSMCVVSVLCLVLCVYYLAAFHGLIHHPRSSTNCVYEQEPDKKVNKVLQRTAEP